MKTTYISRAKFGKFTAAIAAAALLAGTAAPGVLAADYTAQLTKTIDMTAAPGAGVPHGSITFTVGTVANLPSWAAGTAVKGTAAQIKSTELIGKLPCLFLVNPHKRCDNVKFIIHCQI